MDMGLKGKVALVLASSKGLGLACARGFYKEGRLGNPEELANIVVFLTSDKASYITETVIQVDGDLVKRIF